MIKPQWQRHVIGAAVMLVLPAVLWLVASSLVPQYRMTTGIETFLANVTGAEAELGSASVKVVGGLGLTISGGRIVGDGPALARHAGLQTNIKSYVMEFSQLDISLELLPLLKRQVAVKAIHLVGTQLVIVDHDTLRLREFDVTIDNLWVDLASDAPGIGAAPGDRIPADLSFDLEFLVAELSQSASLWQDVRLSGAWATRQLQITAVTGQMGDGHLTAAGTLAYDTDPWGRLDWRAELVGLPTGSLLAPYLPDLAGKLDCGLSGDVTGGMDLRDPDTRRDSLELKGQISSSDGELRAADWLEDVSRYLGRRQDLKTVRFSRLTHEFRVADGRYLVDTLEIDGQQTDWQVAGWLGFAGDLGLNVGIRLPAGFTPDLGAMSFLAESMRDDDGRVNLGLKLSGQTAAPDIGVDFGSLGGR